MLVDLEIATIFGSGIIGLWWAYHNYQALLKIRVDTYTGISDEDENQLTQNAYSIQEIGSIIKEGASQFIQSEYKACSIFLLIMGALIFACVDKYESFYTTFSYLLGASTSMACGAFGMKIATFANYRTTHCAKASLGNAFKTAFKSGTVIGFTLVSLAMMILLFLILIYKSILGLQDTSNSPKYFEFLFQTVAGYGLGGSTVALFARVGGGIFTKAADLGSDLVGKIESGLPEDSPKNPATIADNVGDNVGDIAGMGADLFGSFAESTCAALILGSNSIVNARDEITFESLIFVLMIPAVGILVSLFVTTFITEGREIQDNNKVESSLKNQLIFSTLGLLPALFIISSFFMPTFTVISTSNTEGTPLKIEKTYFQVFVCLALGLVGGLIIGYVTQIMTSHSYNPVRELADSCKMGSATNVIYGLALGYFSTIVPVIVLCFICYYSHSSLGFYGVALAALGMLSNLPICLTIDSYGPISDNAGGIAEMAELQGIVRERTDVLDAAGNTTAAVGKGFAIGSATLVGFALYGGFLHNIYSVGKLTRQELSFDDPLVFSCLLFGSMIPYAFSALTIKSVGKAALGMIQEVRRQIRYNPDILTGQDRPDYKSCVRISTNSSLKQMIAPGILVTLTPFLLGILLGPQALVGFLPGAIISGVQMAISASNTGGAWDNAKKYIEAGLMIDESGNKVTKGTQIHKAAVTGDTVGDPLKDTSGPSLNILIKLMAILSLVFCQYFSQV